MNQFVKEMSLDPSYSTGLAGRSKELGRAGYYFVLAFALSFIFMYMVLAAQLESFISPDNDPLVNAAVSNSIRHFVAVGDRSNSEHLFRTRSAAVASVVKKNAILQIDHTNQFVSAEWNDSEAIIRGNRDRLRPILMTNDRTRRRYVAADNFDRARFRH